MALLASCSSGTCGRKLEGLNNFDWLVEGKIARSDQPDYPLGYQTLKQMGFRTVWNLRDDRDEINAVVEAGMIPFRYPMNVYLPPSIKVIEEIVYGINNEENQPSLFHCMRGADRTGLIAAAHRIMIDGWSYDRAYNEMVYYIPEGVEIYPLIRLRLKELALKYGRGGGNGKKAE